MRPRNLGIESVARDTSSSMTRLVPLLLLAMALCGCFDPDTEMALTPAEAQAGECMPDGDLCSVNGDCCTWDGSTRSGAGLCVNFGDVAECTGICYADGDCSQGCCGALNDTPSYGACGPCSAPPFVASASTCLQGVAFFCGCGDALGVPCGDDRATFEQSCASGNSPADVFECFAENAGSSCGDALEACPVELLVEAMALR